MIAHSQAELEYQLEQRKAQLQQGQLTPRQFFGSMADWTLHLGERMAFLQPEEQHWLWYDRLHQSWTYSGFGLNQVILLTQGRIAGVKRLPQPGPVAEWCVYQHGGRLHDPVRFEHLRTSLQSGQVPETILIWTPRAAYWLSPAQFMALPV
jgi:hypothetical protein